MYGKDEGDHRSQLRAISGGRVAPWTRAVRLSFSGCKVASMPPMEVQLMIVDIVTAHQQITRVGSIVR